MHKLFMNSSLLKMPSHDGFRHYISQLNHLYLKEKAIWKLDHTYDGFKWVDCKSDNRCVFGFTRTDGEQSILVVFNFSDREAAIAPELDSKVTILLNTDWEPFGGSTKEAMCKSIPNVLPPFGGMMFSYTP